MTPSAWKALTHIRLPEGGAVHLLDADRALLLGREAALLTSAGSLTPLPWGPLGEDAAVTLAGGLVALRDNARLSVFDHTTLTPLGQLEEAPGILFRSAALSAGRLVTWSTSHRVTVWDLRALKALATHSHRDARALCGLGGADDPPAIAKATRLGRRVRLSAHHAVTGETLRVHHVGLPHRARAAHVVVIPTPEGLLSAITTVGPGEQVTTLHQHSPDAHRALRRFVEPNPLTPPEVWGLSMETPGLVDCVCWGRRFTLSLLTGHITPSPPDGETTPSGLRLTFAGALLDLHHGGPVQRPFGEEAVGEAIMEVHGGLRALTRAGDTLTWWSLTR